MSLPVFIQKNNRLLMAFVCGIAFMLGYSLPNHYHLFEPQLLPLTTWDEAIPLMPWTIFLYTSEYILFVSAYFMFRHELTRNKYIWAYFGVLLVGATFFVLFPTTYPRGNYPLPTGDVTSTTLKLFSLLRSLDNPSNCFPSMHVACCYLTAFAFLERSESRLSFWAYFTWSTLIALSTLPTKQHYIVDILGGLILSVAGYWIFFKQIKYVSLAEYSRRLRQLIPSDWG